MCGVCGVVSVQKKAMKQLLKPITTPVRAHPTPLFQEEGSTTREETLYKYF